MTVDRIIIIKRRRKRRRRGRGRGRGRERGRGRGRRRRAKTKIQKNERLQTKRRSVYGMKIVNDIGLTAGFEIYLMGTFRDLLCMSLSNTKSTNVY